MTIQSEVPFGRALYFQLHLNGQHLSEVARHDQFESHYLAWETVRKETNPFFVQGTGFEGYFVGRCELPEAALESILAVSQHMLDAIARLYRFQSPVRTRLMNTLTRESSDLSSIHIWSAYLGAELGKLRMQILGDPKAEVFRTQTYKLISTLPPMRFQENDADVTQTYAVAAPHDLPPGKLVITSQMLNPSQQDAWLVAQNIGQFGHPLVRKILDRI